MPINDGNLAGYASLRAARHVHGGGRDSDPALPLSPLRTGYRALGGGRSLSQRQRSTTLLRIRLIIGWLPGDRRSMYPQPDPLERVLDGRPAENAGDWTSPPGDRGSSCHSAVSPGWIEVKRPLWLLTAACASS